MSLLPYRLVFLSPLSQPPKTYWRFQCTRPSSSSSPGRRRGPAGRRRTDKPSWEKRAKKISTNNILFTCRNCCRALFIFPSWFWSSLSTREEKKCPKLQQNFAFLVNSHADLHGGGWAALLLRSIGLRCQRRRRSEKLEGHEQTRPQEVQSGEAEPPEGEGSIRKNDEQRCV